MSEEATPQKAVRDPESFREALEAWMRKQRTDLQDLRVVDVDMPRSTGFSNETVFFTASWKEDGKDASERYVARIEPRDGAIFPIQTPACQVSVEVQHRIMSQVGATGVAPVPTTLPYEGDPSVLGSPFFVMNFVEGVIPADVPRYSTDGFLVDEATPEERERMVMSGVDCMAAINQLDWREIGADWLDISGRGEPTFQMQLDVYQQYTEAELAGRHHPVMDRAHAWLADNAPHDAALGLSWGDSRLGNMIWYDYRCAAVVDWEACSLCPPDADIGWWVMFDRQSFDDMGAPRLEGFPTREEMIARWEGKMGRSVAGSIDYWEIFATMRFCAIMIKLSGRFMAAGFQTEETSTAVNNGVTEALDRLLSRQGG